MMPSASLVPHDDPSLLFTTAGMVPFKDMFIGKKKPPCVRLASSQKCVRAGGKHNDLEQVGHTLRHHTFFEMLGNFSIGDYFKEKAILYAWTFLTQELGLKKDRLWVTVYHEDTQARDLWKKISGLSCERILSITTDDNFWSAGDSGPCGPCSEIFYDHGPSFSGGLPGTPEQDGDRFMEIWNLVFMQYDQVDGKRIPLPQQSIDTGMGLERLASVMQGVGDNFKTDIFKALITRSQELVCHKEEGGPAHRVIADHLRSTCFLIADGVLPEAEGRGYVLRRILRRALRYIHNIGGKTDHLSRLVPVLIEKMGQDYPELIQHRSLIEKTLTHEAERFDVLLGRGLELLERWIDQAPGQKLDGQRAFQLYDTYGFPLDLTCDVLREKGHSGVDEEGFYRAMDVQKEASRKSWPTAMTSGSHSLDLSYLAATEFTGYDQQAETASILKIESLEGQDIDQLEQGQNACIVTDRTCFYGESGGQVGDCGQIIKETGAYFKVKDTRWQDQWTVHYGVMEKGILCRNDKVMLKVDPAHRLGTSQHHSATHLLQAALRSVLGEHVAQKGSLVKSNGLRFDFSHSKPLSDQEIKHVENWINKAIWDNVSITTEVLSHKEAIHKGALAFFGEKYETDVRVITMDAFSKELCGGVHVPETGVIGLFKIQSQSAVGSGVRRIEAVVGQAALAYFQDIEDQMRQACGLLKTTLEGLVPKVQDLAHRPMGKTQGHLDWIKDEEGFWWARGDDRPINALRTELDWAKDVSKGIVLAIVEKEGGVNLHMALGQTYESVDATTFLKTFMGVHGRGGGSASMSQGASSQWTRAQDVASAFKEFLQTSGIKK